MPHCTLYFVLIHQRVNWEFWTSSRYLKLHNIFAWTFNFIHCSVKVIQWEWKKQSEVQVLFYARTLDISLKTDNHSLLICTHATYFLAESMHNIIDFSQIAKLSIPGWSRRFCSCICWELQCNYLKSLEIFWVMNIQYRNTGTSFHITQLGLRSLGGFWHTWNFHLKWH